MSRILVRLGEIYPKTVGALGKEPGSELSQALTDKTSSNISEEEFPEFLFRWVSTYSGQSAPPMYIAELSMIELAFFKASSIETPPEPPESGLSINPSLSILRLDWSGLCGFFEQAASPTDISEKEEIVGVYLKPGQTVPVVRPILNEELLALKIIGEGLDPMEVARASAIEHRSVSAAINQTVNSGLVLSSGSLIKRPGSAFTKSPITDEKFLRSEVFVLQWHITQACDLNCPHCYDRSDREQMPLETGMKVLRDLYHLCRQKNCHGQVSFSGGNPFLYPGFFDLYERAAQMGFTVAVLGNPVSEDKLVSLLRIKQPAFFQVSLEGLQIHNDSMRGPGHFKRTLEFLGLLKKHDIYSMVMLTLTGDNIQEVLPLSEQLKGLADTFNWNRLSQSGSGSALSQPEKEEFQEFLKAYHEARKTNPTLGLKDNLICIERERGGLGQFGGCTGYGCGAAFNFLSVLSDGQAHACRKFPSALGNAFETSLLEIYESELAEKYRGGCQACSDCRLRAVCGGCMAVVNGMGLDPFMDKDPFCYLGHQ